MILFSVTISTHVVLETGFYHQAPHLLGIANPIVFSFGPLFLLYTRLQITGPSGIKRRFLWHFFPFGLCLAYWTPFFLSSGEDKILQAENPSEASILGYLITTSQIILMVGYLIYVYLIVIRHRASLEETHSTVEGANLDWMASGLRWFLFLSLLLILNTVLHYLGIRQVADIIGNVVLILLVVIIYGIGYRGLKQPEIFLGEQESKTTEKYSKSTLTEEDGDRFTKRLIKVMEDEKPYLDGNLTIRQLGDLARIPSYHLSRILNERLGLKFFDFVNKYRVEEAKRRLSDPACSHLSILSIGLDVGFNSKSAFNAAFKKLAGTTPSKFRKNI
ncbi:MAG: helix-turn-helix transcriptional regulator [Candidatus Krumholzibacteria bacterium]|nr:helix-turn-helix transcriptional regulator [Candidatus Krumholzibacteria bacterium]